VITNIKCPASPLIGVLASSHHLTLFQFKFVCIVPLGLMLEKH